MLKGGDKMAKTVIGVFDMEDNAQSAIEELRDLGYDPKDMSIIMKDTREAERLGNGSGVNVASGAATGAVTGAVVGGLAGLLVGIGAIAIPGVGAFLIGGPLAVALGLTGAAASTTTGVATGAIAGGLIGALMSFGIPEDQAKRYEERIQAGGILLAVPTIDRRSNEVQDILSENGAADVSALNLPEDYEESDARGVTNAPEDEEYVNSRYAYRHRTLRNQRRIK